MLRTTLASSRALRVGVLGLVTVTTAILITSDSAEARRHRRHTARHHHSESASARESYSPQFATIIVDGNTGSVLNANSPDGLRHPASLTKIMTLYLLFERFPSMLPNRTRPSSASGPVRPSGSRTPSRASSPAPPMTPRS